MAAAPKKTVSPFVWLFAGCGTLLLLGVIIVAAVGFYGYYKVKQVAKEAGLDSETMQKNPAMTIAKLLVATNPDIELVSVDENKGLITVKDKKSGKVVTVNLDEAQKGKITFEGESDDDKVTFEARGSEEHGGFEVKSKDGKLTIGSGSQKDLPDWIPAYPGIEMSGSVISQDGNGKHGNFQFSTSDPVDKVIDFYKTEFERAGMKVTNNSVKLLGALSAGNLTADSTDKKRHVVVSVIPYDTQTTVNVAYEMKN
jgi:hypothetical protein